MNDLQNISVLNEIQLRQAREGKILPFTKRTMPDYQINWHHRLMCKTLNQFVAKKIRRLMMFTQPRVGKSELTSRRLPALWHGVYPNDEILMATYNGELAKDMTVDVQRIMDKPEYREIFPTVRITPEGTKSAYARNKNEHEIMPYQDPVSKLWQWHTGSFRSAGVGGAFTGRGANLILVDDPFKNRQEADSLATRDKVYKFYQSALRTRLEGEGSILITMTRWHEDDLAGRLLAAMKKDPMADQWTVLTLPAIKTDNSNPNDPRQIGDVLWPEKFPYDAMMKLKGSVGPREWSALYQQEPTPDGGGLFKSEMFEFGYCPTEYDWTFIIADTSYKDKQENDFTVFTHFGVKNDQLYVDDVFREQIKAADVEAKVTPFIKKRIKYGFRGTYIEPKGHGIYLNQAWAGKGYMIPSESSLEDFFSDRRLNKVERANNVVPHLANRKIIINTNLANKEELLAECLKFPQATHDDFIDTLIDAVKMVYARELSILDVL